MLHLCINSAEKNIKTAQKNNFKYNKMCTCVIMSIDMAVI